jgi:hypothetical protein
LPENELSNDFKKSAGVKTSNLFFGIQKNTPLEMI